MSGGFTTNYNAGGVIDKVKNIASVGEIGRIKNFPQKTQPFNTMECFDVPAIKSAFEFEMLLPDVDFEILALTVTCSGYGEDDNYDLFFNDIKWFDHWYCSEVKEGLFLGTSTFVYAAPASAKVRLIFRNSSGTAKKVWLGVRMLVDPVQPTP